MPAPWETLEMVQAAGDFIEQESRAGRDYPPTIFVGVEFKPGGTVTHWKLPVPAEEFHQRLDDFMHRNEWPVGAEIWGRDADREVLEMAVMKVLQLRNCIT